MSGTYRYFPPTWCIFCGITPDIYENPHQTFFVTRYFRYTLRDVARYISHLLGHDEYDHIQALSEIIFHKQAQKFLQRKKPYFPPEDPVLCLQRDVYDFVLRAEQDGDLVVVKKI